MAITGIFDNDITLPGVITEIIPDYSQDYDTSKFGTTESVTIIGTAFNGPVGKVVPIFSPEHAKYIFGDSFDPKTRREATLVAEIYDAWDRGCRTIYAVRVSGKEIYKDYQLATETKLKLRVSGIFPSNLNKDVFLHFNTEQLENGAAGVIRIYKPIDRANMKEKIQGLVFSQSELLVNEIKLDGYGITKDSRLSDVIGIVNGLENNNVIRLAIVDENGGDVTVSSKEAQSLCLGVVFPGLYTIGRDEDAEGVTPKTEIEYALSVKEKPHSNYQEAIWKKLILNSDVSVNLPIYGKSINDLSALLPIAADANGDWLKPIGMIDKIAVKNKKDYEEVELDEFDIYKRLGSGYAQTAQIIALKDTHDSVRGYKVVVPNTNDPNRVVGIMDGIYSVLQNHSTNYTVLTGMVNAETKISGKLPRKDSFKKRKAGTFNLTESRAAMIELMAKIDPKDFTAAKDCKVTINSISSGINQAEILGAIDTSLKITRIVSTDTAGETAAAKLPEGTKVAVVEGDYTSTTIKVVQEGELVVCKEDGMYLVESGATLKSLSAEDGRLLSTEKGAIIQAEYSAGAGKLKVVEASSQDGTANVKTITKGKAIIAVNGEIANVYLAGDNNEVKPIAELSQIANKELEEDYTICFVEDLPTGLNLQVFSTEAQWMLYNELVEKLNENTIFSHYFYAKALKGDKEVGASCSGSGKDKGDAYYDTTMYIPYTTTDNFARHLAQHCTYTSLKTFPTHGIIGCAKLNGVNLATVAQRVNEILALDLDLYAKRPNGNNMLNNNNMPHPIGLRISVPFIQYIVTTGNGYNYVSNGAAGYAGTVSALPAERSSTNQPINVPTLAFELSNYQLSQLTGKGIVTIKNTTAGTVITDGVTMAPIDSAYRRLSTAKVMNIVDASLREIIQPFIGLRDNLSNINSMTTAITSRFEKLKESLISYYEFNIIPDPVASALGEVKIQYVIVPYNEINKVHNTLSITKNS